MEVILLEKMRHLGTLGAKVNVKSGFARNYLIPQGKAVYATKENLAKFEERRAELEKLANERLEQATEKQTQIQSLPALVFSAKASEEGKLFGSITSRDIADMLNKAGADIEKRQVRLTQGPIRSLGEYEVHVDLESDISAIVKVTIISEHTR